MHISTPVRAATAVLLAIGMSAFGTTAAFADDAPPSADPTIASEPTEPAEPAEPTEPAEPAEPTEPTEPTEPAELTEPASEAIVATEVPEAETPPTTVADPTPYVLLAWRLPCGIADPFCAPGQSLGHALDLADPTLSALDSLIVGTCDDWQVDLEWNSPTTAALIAAGMLTAPGAPAEDHAHGSLGEGINPWKYVDNPDCAPAEVVTPAAVIPAAVVAAPAVVVPRVVTTRSAQQTQQLPTLALTGSNPTWMIWTALAMLAVGLVVIQVQAMGRRRVV